MRKRRKDTAQRHQLGRYWLYQRPDTGTWCICWLDTSAVGRVGADGKPGRAVTRRKATAIEGGSPDRPPQGALDALVAHHEEFSEKRKLPKHEAYVEGLTADWLDHHVSTLDDPDRYRQSVDRWVDFYDREAQAGRIVLPLKVSDVTPALVTRFINWRRDAGVGGHAISRDLAALRGPLNWAWKTHRLEAAPYIPDVPPTMKAGPRDRVLSFAEVAKMMELAAANVEREHVLRFMIVELGTAGRPEAILELRDSNIDLEHNLIDPNQPGRRHLRKRRTVVPIARHVRPWVEDVTGKLIKYRVPIAARHRVEGGPTHFEKETASIKTSWNAICIEAGVCEPLRQPVVDAKGKPVLDANRDPVMADVRDAEGNVIMVPNATPKTLRHTMLTWLARRGVPKEERNMLAGHVPQDTTGKNYEHLTPDYLAGAIAQIDAYFEELSKHTKVHLRSASDPRASGLRLVAGGRS